MRFGVADDALKHGVEYEHLLYIVCTADYLGPDPKGVLWWLGVTPDGLAVEVGAVTARDDSHAIVIIHGMPMKWRKS